MTNNHQATISPEKHILISAKTVGQAIDTWLAGKSRLTQHGYLVDIKQFFACCFEGFPYESVLGQDILILKDIKLESIQSFANHLMSFNRSKNTIGRKITAIKSFFTFLQKTGVIAGNPGSLIAPKIDRSISAKRFIDQYGMKKLLSMPATKETPKEKRDRIIVKTLYYTALRANEMCSITWKNIILKSNGSAIIELSGKGDKHRSVLIPAHLVEDLLSIKKEGSELLFQSRESGNLTTRQLQRIVKDVAVKHGLSAEISPNYLRHSHASNALDNGASILLIKNTLGHSSIATTERYLHAKITECSSMYL